MFAVTISSGETGDDSVNVPLAGFTLLGGFGFSPEAYVLQGCTTLTQGKSSSINTHNTPARINLSYGGTLNVVNELII
jgi:hypothetical protein